MRARAAANLAEGVALNLLSNALVEERAAAGWRKPYSLSLETHRNLTNS